VLLDSNIVILAATGRHDRLLDLFQGGNATVSAVSRIEVLGFSHLTPEDESELEELFDLVTVLPVSEEVVARATLLRRRRKMSLGDAIIAATALAHGVPLATANIEDFAWIDELEVVDPTKL
jgi:hypothetical protein